MYCETTAGITITVKPSYLDTQSSPENSHFVWAYHIRIENNGSRQPHAADDVENLSQIWAVAPALVKLALRDVEPSQKDKEPPWKRIAKGRRWAM